MRRKSKRTKERAVGFRERCGEGCRRALLQQLRFGVRV